LLHKIEFLIMAQVAVFLEMWVSMGNESVAASKADLHSDSLGEFYAFSGSAGILPASAACRANSFASTACCRRRLNADAFMQAGRLRSPGLTFFAGTRKF